MFYLKIWFSCRFLFLIFCFFRCFIYLFNINKLYNKQDISYMVSKIYR